MSEGRVDSKGEMAVLGAELHDFTNFLIGFDAGLGGILEFRLGAARVHLKAELAHHRNIEAELRSEISAMGDVAGGGDGG